MGALSFLKSIFIAEKLEEDSVSLEDIQDWFGEKSSVKIDFLKGQIEGVNEKIREESGKVKENIEKLRNASLRNPNIPERAKHFMDGNREAYMKNAAFFVDSLKLPEDVNSLGEFFMYFSKELEEFGKSTSRPFHILKEFLDDEASAISSNFRNIDNYVKEMKAHREKSGISEIELISKLINNLFGKIKRKEDLENAIGEKQRQLELSRQDLEKMEKEAKGIRESEEFNDYTLSKQKLVEIKSRLKLKEEVVLHPFALLDRPLRKFERSVVTDKDVLDVYMKSPVDGITQDFGLKIVRILDNLKKAAEDNTLELKDKQRDIVLREISNLDKDTLSRFQAEYGRMKKEEKDMQARISFFDIMERINEAEENMRIKASLLKTLEHNIQSMQDDLSKIDLEIMKKAIKEKVKDTLKVKLEIQN